MAQGTAGPGGPVTADPGALRAGMAKTREELTRKLGALKRRVSAGPAQPKGTKIMAAKKEKTSTAKKSTGSKKSGGSRPRTVTGKAKKVMKDVLAGAAHGAVAGAAEAAMADLEKASPKPKKSGQGTKTKK